MIVVLPVALLLSWVSVSLDNLLFLHMPHRILPKDPGQFQFMGRLMLVTFLKMMALLLVFGISSVPAVVILVLLDGPPELAALSTVPLLAVFAVAFTWLVGRAFRGFDVGKDVPS